MAKYPPYMNSYGRIKTILDKAKKAATPERFTYDFLETKLSSKGGSAKPFVGFAKRIGLLNSDGTPTNLYDKFRNPATSQTAMAAAIRQGYPELYARNEYAHELDRDALDGLIVEITGLESGNNTVRAIASSFEALKEFANFEGGEHEAVNGSVTEQPYVSPPQRPISLREFDMNVAYTINLVLPKTEDVAVFNAIFKSLRDNLLSK